MHRDLVKKKHWKLLQMVHPGGKELKNDYGQMMLDTQAMLAMSRLGLAY